MINFKDQSILIIAAHPDDEVLGCGGLISRYNNISNINVVFLGEGSSCRFSETNSELAKNSIKQREEAARKAARLLKIKNTEFYNLPKSLTNRLGIDNAQIYVGGSNLLTFDNLGLFSGEHDPEITGANDRDYPNVKTVTTGVRIGF